MVRYGYILAIFVIAVTFVLIPSFAASEIMIVEAESNPTGKDEGNEWIKLYNPTTTDKDISNWIVKSSHGRTETYNIPSGTIIEGCGYYTITFPKQFLDNEDESARLFNQFEDQIDQTPFFNDYWKTSAPKCTSEKAEEKMPVEEPASEEPTIQEPEYLENGCPIDFPYLWSDDFCYDEPESNYLDNGCHVDFPYLWSDGLCYDQPEKPVYEESVKEEPAGMGFYENTLYDFSFEAPTDWRYQESVTMEGLTYPIILYPNEFSLENADDANFLDLSSAMMGLAFQIEAPLISVQFKNIPKSEVPNLNDNSIKDYVEKELRKIIPNVKIQSSSIEGRSWGWIVKDETAQSIDIGLGQGMPYRAKDTYYVFKDREMYTVGYGTIPQYFDSYTDVYAHTLDTLTIKDIDVSKPEPLPVSLPTGDSGGCLIATAAYGTELAPQVQHLRELRDNSLLKTESGSAFMNGFNQIYYSFSPIIADFERQSPVFKEIVKITITPLITSLSILNHVDMDSEDKVLGYGISLILLNVGMYLAAPVGVGLLIVRKSKNS